ncbi:Aprataxin and PNK-like factor [Eumeta japonica]|uniref:Aprataxin and PNK-like factor n=1 Tax=Eumeta variegata TaxID=151549 RepID=A0A4C1V9I1_EUMVA|nr:Aprataxin and PNK-like factor [Eumeta japonica]
MQTKRHKHRRYVSTKIRREWVMTSEKEGSDQKLILTKNNSCILTHGDKIGLLPDSFWYKLVLHESDSNIINSANGNEVHKEVKESDKENGDQINEDDCNKGQYEGSEIRDEIALDFAIEDGDHTCTQNSPSILETNTEEQRSETTEDYTFPQTLKRCHSTSETDNGEICTKLIKTEQEPSSSKCEDPGSREQNDNITRVVKTESDTSDHAPNDNELLNNEHNNKDTDNAPSTPPPPGNSVKERCMYGANCYRRNPQHKAQYSHPGEAEWGAGERGVCPWGARCRRRDVRHWRDHDHPPGTHPPAPHVNPQPAQKKVKKRDKIKEVSPVNFDNLPAKRVRKAITCPSWSSNESENECDTEDPFLTDGSDEWLPSDTEECTESQDYSQCD